ncbi:hypothetical protein H2200_009744 [Cladophialophora chaetospira]|uniref:F-box domain-containing protein n=1 Tax=Cladophialophora chaetospira TaxID=386627 RepID=A0AA38X335_9EURO|nr:hypothetical protein H2200_009744 [Cladophialophora chaetospira]
MAGILDLPTEILAQCASHMERKDLRNLLVTSKRLSKLKGELFRDITLGFTGNDYSKPMITSTPTYPRPDSRRHVGDHRPRLIDKFCADMTLAQYVRHLRLERVFCKRCVRKHPPNSDDPDAWITRYGGCDCSELPTYSFPDFSNLKALHVVGDMNDLHLQNGLCNIDGIRHLTLEHRGSVSLSSTVFESVVKTIMQPPLRSLKLQNLMIAPPRQDEPQMSYPPSKSIIDKLTIDCGNFSFRHLEKLITELEGLRTLSVLRTRGRPSKWLGYSGPRGAGYDVGELEQAIAAVSDSLEQLKLLHTVGYVYDGYKTTLTSLGKVKRLKRLIIDPSLLIGRRICDYAEPISPIRTPNSLAHLLPPSLEHLAIAIDFEQVSRDSNLRNGIVKGLIEGKTCGHLKRLKQVFFVELICYQGKRAGSCADSRVCKVCYSSDPYRADYRPINIKQAEKFVRAQDVCKSVGIELLLVGEDEVRGRTEEWAKYVEAFDW